MHHPCDLAIKVGATKWVWWWSFAQVTVEQMTLSLYYCEIARENVFGNG